MNQIIFRATKQGKFEPFLIENLYKNATCFLIGSGPSLNNIDLSILQRRGILIAAMNNVAATHVRPNFWFSVDHPKSFCENIYYDPYILKFIPEENVDKSFFIRDKLGKLQPSNTRLYELPSILTYRRNKDFNAETFLTEPTINWGNLGCNTDSLGNKGGRSVMLAALRILFYIGIRRVFLLGCDFNMQPEQPYAFDQSKHVGGCVSNNNNYRILDSRFKALRPYFEAKRYFVYNCTEGSSLKAFDYLPLDTAITQSTQHIPQKIDVRNMYGD